MIKLKELVEDKIDIKKKSEADHLSQEVRKVQEEMAATLHNFENTTEPDLLDYYTYAYKANQIKHDYLLKKLKAVY
ncbi:MAG: DUF2508 domain-containing protein [Epulopiscium sp. Nele67-Bin004]|nr:MAG: DUF2508 domain-containing protein [Epulopiscium sp. Nele67-Bin004]